MASFTRVLDAADVVVVGTLGGGTAVASCPLWLWLWLWLCAPEAETAGGGGTTDAVAAALCWLSGEVGVAMEELSGVLLVFSNLTRLSVSHPGS